ncbi:hypothetical protein ACWT_3143 [Actinoplanes sp. SE50]|uniref:hypothetical protein n=1 Tax=unclassified Actinoplanes TaxID=2626549 RepID=UPI00023EC5F5|nr:MULTISPECIES: hypothetical protein [unclassified Actinoplanes]AEV84166.1 hypothetical protein ACPL_3271 [Actinoplanes sp. SE50/110]ATO82558.1 hypothetical protein ACWT_3143 [Actinoplanes sp. SE50]SLL99965.1 hypothetical protein ACSP50_3197 [Actinoplanes sp. SE50/110]
MYRAVRRGLGGGGGGGTILLHDSDHSAAPDSFASTLGALPAILTHCRARGFTVGPLREHAVRAE